MIGVAEGITDFTEIVVLALISSLVGAEIRVSNNSEVPFSGSSTIVGEEGIEIGASSKGWMSVKQTRQVPLMRRRC